VGVVGFVVVVHPANSKELLLITMSMVLPEGHLNTAMVVPLVLCATPTEPTNTPL